MLNALRDLTGIETSNQLIAFSTTVTMLIATLTLGFLVWDRAPKPLRLRRWQACRRMDATCEIQYTRWMIEQARGEGRQISVDAGFDEIVAHGLERQIKEGEWHTLQTVRCRIEPLGHELVDPRDSYQLAARSAFPYMALSWLIQLPVGTKVSKSTRIVSSGRTHTVMAVFDDHSEAEAVQVVATSVQP